MEVRWQQGLSDARTTLHGLALARTPSTVVFLSAVFKRSVFVTGR
jgi:hypothetical protein